MPWTAADADKHIKGLSANQKKGWAKIANAALKEYNGDEGRAIRTANAKSKQVGKKTDKTKKR